MVSNYTVVGRGDCEFKKEKIDILKKEIGMEEEIRRMKEHCSQLPFCRTFLCLLKKETLPEGIMPRWLTKIVNWCVSE